MDPHRGLSCSLQPHTLLIRGFSGSQFPAVEEQIFWVEFLSTLILQNMSAPKQSSSACALCRPPAGPPGSEFIGASFWDFSRLSSTCLTGSSDSQAQGFVSRQTVLVDRFEETGLPSVCVYLWQLNGE